MFSCRRSAPPFWKSPWSFHCNRTSFSFFCGRHRNGHACSNDARVDFERVVEILGSMHRPWKSWFLFSLCLSTSHRLRRKQPGDFKHGRWCNWGFAAQRFAPKFSATMLCVLWSGIEDCRVTCHIAVFFPGSRITRCRKAKMFSQSDQAMPLATRRSWICA